MQAIILCGGRGTRLREITETLPKPMVEIGGKPILWHIMAIYSHHNIRDFILCLGYKGNVIKDYFLNFQAMNSDFSIVLGENNSIQFRNSFQMEKGWKLSLIDTGENSMTGDRVKLAMANLTNRNETFCVTYGDGISDIDLTHAYQFHKSHGKLATITGVRPPSRFGELEADGDTVVVFNEKPQIRQGLINGGFFFFEPDFARYIPDSPGVALEKEPLEKCVADRQLKVYEHKGFWQGIDTYRDLENSEMQWRSGKPLWKVWK